ncbi:AEC family transporter [Telmatospirillum sp.]|uniref:AEC family transporter n=1 Tax=Telmatospirillum sp. TaxID=2079197 RepID=UPI002846EA67|nr:AEC family transporter [Telmatospirillum sp.]MDR3436263.1 AEC family transporter [Telmatospirillum sp.]
MQAVLSVILPMMALVVLGYLSAWRGGLKAGALEGLSRFVVDFTIPALLFQSIAVEGEPIRFAVIYAYFIGCVALFFASAVLALAWRRHRLPEMGLFALNATYSNTVLMGVPLVQGAFGPRGLHILTMITAFHSLVMLTLATVFVEVGRNRGTRISDVFVKTLRSTVRNPIIMSVVAGALWRMTGLGLPGPIETTLRLLSTAASPCALFMMGATLTTLRIGPYLGEILGVSVIKAIVMPALIWFLAAHVFGLDRLQVAVSTTLAAMPTGVNTFVLAKRFDLYTANSAGTVLLTTVASAVTMSLLLLLMRS